MVDRRRSPETKERILNAAEQLFSDVGYHGTSLRDIANLSKIQLSLIHYHLGSKENVLKEVVERRSGEYVLELEASLNEVLAANGGEPLEVEDLIGAFVRPGLERLVCEDPGWRYYIKLLAHLAFESQRADYAVPFHVYDDVVARFIAELERCLPRANRKDIHWAFYFLQTAYTGLLLETRLIDRQSNGLCDSSDIDEVVGAIRKFFTAGISFACSKAKR